MMDAQQQAQVDAAYRDYAGIHPSVIRAIENHRDEFIALLQKILAATEDNLVSVTLQDRDDDKPAEPDQSLVDEVKALMMAVYLTTFMIQDLPPLNEAFQQFISQAQSDGHAYAIIKRLMRH